MHDETIKNH